MRVTIEIPEARCRRCGGASPLKPSFIRPIGKQAQNTPSGFVATDDAGGSWLLTAENPEGWSQILDDSTALLCAGCTAKLNAAVQAFLDEAAPAATQGSSTPILAAPAPVLHMPLPTRAQAPRTSSIPNRANTSPAVTSTTPRQAEQVAPVPIPSRAAETATHTTRTAPQAAAAAPQTIPIPQHR